MQNRRQNRSRTAVCLDYCVTRTPGISSTWFGCSWLRSSMYSISPTGSLLEQKKTWQEPKKTRTRNREVPGCLFLHIGPGGAANRDRLPKHHGVQMFRRMLSVAIVEAGLAMMFFMHLWSEKRGFGCLFWFLQFLCCWRCSTAGPTVSGWSTAEDTVRERESNRAEGRANRIT